LPLILASAATHGIKVSFHMEPYHERTPMKFLEDIKYIVDTYGASPAFYRHPKTGKPCKQGMSAM
jgi:glycoprotein endo-alpha-1,2-mannosidase